MLSSLRKISETIIAKIFITIIALSFVFWGINDFFRSNNSNLVAEIDGEEISFNQFINEFNKIITNLLVIIFSTIFSIAKISLSGILSTE